MRIFLVAKEFTCSNKRIFCSIHPGDVRSNLEMHLSDTPFAIRQPIWRPRLLERVHKPIRTPHWCGALADPGGVLWHMPPPTGSIFFVFAYVFAEKCMRWRLVPPPTGRHPPQREILDPPLWRLAEFCH